MNTIIDTPFGFFLDLSKVIAIHKPELVYHDSRHSSDVSVKFKIIGGTHAGEIEYERWLWETGESRHPEGQHGAKIWDVVEVLVETEGGAQEWQRYPVRDDVKVVGLERLQREVAVLVEEWAKA